MSTRANVRVIDAYGSILLYRHRDGSPECMMPLLRRLMTSDNAESTARSLIKDTECHPAAFIHTDIEWFYDVRLQRKDIGVTHVNDRGDMEPPLRTGQSSEVKD